ncbi:hypothetical protein BofuT4_uP121080.1 [Botrytis cinerea T4]|uniref:Uncharacterized protein n=1 Tax=Botryotinia fuckeliana (strain T4) TaxID=999810 RepID=G2YN91_BOTF4|nr:hypothetical protein BofuT4_uP121080.1 [Botrytis cinerea T4]
MWRANFPSTPQTHKLSTLRTPLMVPLPHSYVPRVSHPCLYALRQDRLILTFASGINATDEPRC